MPRRASLLASSCAAMLLAVAAAGSGASRAAPASLRLADFVAADEPAWSRGGRIAFVASTAPGYQARRALYVMNEDGSGLRRLSGSGFTAAWPSWSPDGRSIAFAQRALKPPGPLDVYVINADGTGLHKIVGDVFDPAWSPGGKRIAFSKDLKIVTASPSGGAMQVAADPGPETGGEGSCKSNGFFEPTWSPDGELVAFSVSAGGGECGFDVYIGVNRGYGAKTKVLASGWFTDPDWSPKGGAIALTRFSPSTGLPVDVGIYDLRTKRTRYLRKGWHPRWSPDATSLVFVRGTYRSNGQRSEIYVMDADGSDLRQLTR